MAGRLVTSPSDTAVPILPTWFAGFISAFASPFIYRFWRHAQFPMVGAILILGRRTVTSVPRIMGRTHERRFVNAHRILTSASATAARLLASTDDAPD